MKPRWREITIPIEITVALIAALIVSLPMLHPLRVWVAGGVWCAQSVPNGGLKVLYGAEACNIPAANQQPWTGKTKAPASVLGQTKCISLEFPC
ncbi:hypothetical protein H6F95_27695 [Cyanobacteria bacterium FACHB-471]|nr:hypothetical protein [Cyanobacteria bacterium FACHB-471]